LGQSRAAKSRNFETWGPLLLLNGVDWSIVNHPKPNNGGSQKVSKVNRLKDWHGTEAENLVFGKKILG
jgi:hypothetical protein